MRVGRPAKIPSHDRLVRRAECRGRESCDPVNTYRLGSWRYTHSCRLSIKWSRRPASRPVCCKEIGRMVEISQHAAEHLRRNSDSRIDRRRTGRCVFILANIGNEITADVRRGPSVRCQPAIQHDLGFNLHAQFRERSPLSDKRERSESNTSSGTRRRDVGPISSGKIGAHGESAGCRGTRC